MPWGVAVFGGLIDPSIRVSSWPSASNPQLLMYGSWFTPHGLGPIGLIQACPAGSALR